MTQTDPPTSPQNDPNTLAPLTIDARGLSCPLPVLKLNKALKTLPGGAEVILLATDSAALRDIPAYCASHGHRVEAAKEREFLRFSIRKIA